MKAARIFLKDKKNPSNPEYEPIAQGLQAFIGTFWGTHIERGAQIWGEADSYIRRAMCVLIEFRYSR